MSRFVMLSRYSYWPGRARISRVLRPAVIASGLPDNVPACKDQHSAGRWKTKLLGYHLAALVSAGTQPRLPILHRSGLPTVLMMWQCVHLVHGASGGHRLHDVTATAICAHWQTAANDLAHGRQVWCDTEMVLHESDALYTEESVSSVATSLPLPRMASKATVACRHIYQPDSHLCTALRNPEASHDLVKAQ